MWVVYVDLGITAIGFMGKDLERIGLSFGTVHILVRQALAGREMTSFSQLLLLQRKAEARGPRSDVDR